MNSTAKSFDGLAIEPAVHEDEELKQRAEMIDGQIVYKALPGGEHAAAEYSFTHGIGAFFNRKKRNDGTGGWWILPEISIQYLKISEKGRMLTADIAGWKRSEVPERPKGNPIKISPHWVCEICHTTRKKDTILVPETLCAEGVEWYWFVDVEENLLTVFHLENGRYSVVKTWSKDFGNARIPPFDAVEFSLSVLFGDEPEDE